MIVLRVFALVLIALALMLLGADALGSMEQGAITIRDTSQFWSMVHEPSLTAVQEWVKDGAPEYLSVPIDFILKSPAWAVSGVFGVVLAVLFGRRS